MTAKYLFVVQMDVDLAHEDLFNEVYDTEHVPFLLEVPGVVSCRRYKSTAFEVAIGGQINQHEAASPAYTALYEIESPDVMTSQAWQDAVEKGRWPSVRPHTSNRRHTLMRAS